MTQFKVIEGGVRPGRVRPVVWNRMGGPHIVALLLQEREGEWLLGYEVGEPFIVGIRTIAPSNPRAPAVIEAWKALATENGWEVRDERVSEHVRLADGPALQGLVPGVAPVDWTRCEIYELQRRRATRRGAAPLPAGGLFDEGAREQQELF